MPTLGTAKYFTIAPYGDVKVALGQDEDQEPEIRFHFFVEGVGDSSIAIGFNAAQQSVASSMFEKIDEEAARLAVEAGAEQIHEFFADVMDKSKQKPEDNV